MSPLERAEGSLRALVGAVEAERSVLDTIAQRLAAAPGAQPDQAADGPARAYLAVELHKYYTALESLLERLLKALDGAVPSGDRSHQRLLEQAATPVQGIRPAILDRATMGELTHLLSFRHFFRHAYAVELDWERLEAHRTRVGRCHLLVVAGVDGCLTHVRAVLDGLADT